MSPAATADFTDLLDYCTYAYNSEKYVLIPVVETRKFVAAMKGKKNFTYYEVPDGDHDSSLWVDIDLEKIVIRDKRYQNKPRQ